MESLSAIFGYHACIHVCSKNTPFALSTKVFEYIGLGRKVLSINYGGEIVSLLAPYPDKYLINFKESQSREVFENLIKFLRTEYGSNASNQNYDYHNITKNFVTELELVMQIK